jgi:DNA-binding NarL/FixJ family response regulator
VALISVLLADDHELVLAGLKALLATAGTVEVVGEAITVDEAIELARDTKPEVALVDYDFGQTEQRDGLDALAALREVSPGTRVIMLTQYDDHRIVVDAIRAGASGYVLKTATRHELLGAIEAVHQGRVFLSPEAQLKLANEVGGRSEIGDAVGGRLRESLTSREMEVLRLVCHGLTNGEIAEALGIAQGTVKAHLAGIFEKFGVRDRVQVAVEAVARGVVVPHKRPGQAG